MSNPQYVDLPGGGTAVSVTFPTGDVLPAGPAAVEVTALSVLQPVYFRADGTDAAVKGGGCEVLTTDASVPARVDVGPEPGKRVGNAFAGTGPYAVSLASDAQASVKVEIVPR